MKNTFTDFLKANIWGIITTMLICGINYGILISRLEAVEKRLAEHDIALQQLASVRTMDYRLSMIQDELKEVKSKMNNYDQNIQKFYKEDWARVEAIIRQVEIMYRPYTNRKQ